MKKLAKEIAELRHCGEILIGISETLAEMFCSEATASTEPDAEMPSITLEQVRAVLAEKSRSGHTAEVKELLTKYGADKLSEIDPSKYPELLADAEVL